MPRRCPVRASQQLLLAETLESRRLLSTTSAGTDPGAGVGTFADNAAYEQWLVDAAVRQWEGLFDQPAYGFGPDVFLFDDAMGGAREAGVPVAVVAADAAPDASTTNVQVSGVDEADLVETDGQRVYTLGRGRLSIVDGIAGTPAVVGQFELPSREQAAGMYLAGERLTILTTSPGDRVPAAWSDLQSSFWQRFTTSPHTTVLVLDVSDPTMPEVVSRTRVDGQLVASRMVAGQLRLVMNHAFDPPPPRVIPLAEQGDLHPTVPPHAELVPHHVLSRVLESPPWRWKPEGTYESQATYVARVAEQLLASMHPHLYHYDAAGVVTSVVEQVAAEAIDIPQTAWIDQLTTVAAIDIAADAEPTMAAVGLLTSGAVDVYASADSVYVFARHASLFAPPGVPVIATDAGTLLWEPPVTDVARVEIAATGEASVSLTAVGQFEGTLLNRFAVGEHNGVLRAVVAERTDGHGVVVLEPQGESLAVVGSLGGIAANEQLYAARIVEDRAYFVTFQFTDPLFVVDLSVPTAPTLLGELHVPGYADHLQPLADGLLLAIGRDADERTGMFRGLQLSLFDVNDPANPALLHRYTFPGGRGTSTPITGNRWLRGDGDPLALGFFPERGVVTIPLTSEGAPWWWGGPAGDVVADSDSSTIRPALAVDAAWLPPPPKQMLEVIHVDAEAGIIPLGSIDHADSVERAVRVGDRLVAVSAATLSVHDFTEPATVLASLDLEDVPRIPIGEMPRGPGLAVLADFLEQGFPLFEAWAVQAIETVGDEEVAYATHASGAVHRLVRSVSEDGWAGFAFDRVSNLENSWLDPQLRGRAAPLMSPGDVPPVASLVSDGVLEKLGLRRHNGRLVRDDAPTG